MNHSFKSLVGMLTLISAIVASPAFAGNGAGWIELETIFNEGVTPQISGAYAYDFRRGLGVQAFATNIEDYTNVLAGIGVSPASGLYLAPSVGFDDVAGDTRFRYGVTGIISGPFGMTQVLIVENGANGNYLKTLTRAPLKSNITLLWRADTGKGWGPGLEVKATKHVTLSITTLHGFSRPVNLLGLRYQF